MKRNKIVPAVQGNKVSGRAGVEKLSKVKDAEEK
jgi:hypothetical protein